MQRLYSVQFFQLLCRFENFENNKLGETFFKPTVSQNELKRHSSEVLQDTHSWEVTPFSAFPRHLCSSFNRLSEKSMGHLNQAHKFRYPLMCTPLGSCSHMHPSKAQNKQKSLKGSDTGQLMSKSQERVGRPGVSLSNSCQGSIGWRDRGTGMSSVEGPASEQSPAPIPTVEALLIWDTKV